MTINRFNAILTDSNKIKFEKHPFGSWMKVDNLLDILREKRFESLSDTDGKRRWFIEELIKEIGEKV